jgi:hypothetical protein
MVRYDRIQHRFWVAGRRVHHGAAGCLLAAFGVLLMWHDRHDIPWTRDTA